MYIVRDLMDGVASSQKLRGLPSGRCDTTTVPTSSSGRLAETPVTLWKSGTSNSNDLDELRCRSRASTIIVANILDVLKRPTKIVVIDENHGRPFR